MTEQKPNVLSGLVSLIILAGVVWYFFGGGLDKQVASDMQEIHWQVVNDSIRQYEIAARNGSAMDACVQAGMVVASLLQAKAEEPYIKWKKVEETQCKRAGL